MGMRTVGALLVAKHYYAPSYGYYYVAALAITADGTITGGAGKPSECGAAVVISPPFWLPAPTAAVSIHALEPSGTIGALKSPAHHGRWPGRGETG
jgi:hypothetical protein